MTEKSDEDAARKERQDQQDRTWEQADKILKDIQDAAESGKKKK